MLNERTRAYLLLLTSGVFLLEPWSSSARYRGKDDCTSGFMSLDRIHALLESRGNYLERFYYGSWQGLIPGINFTCSGNIHSWIFGARWDGNTDSFTELQIWRSSGNGSYTKVGNTTIMTEDNTTQFHRYPLSSPLPFQEGDILGFYQPAHWMCQLGLLFEFGYDRRVYYVKDVESPASHLNMRDLSTSPNDLFHLLVSVETDSPGCNCGFMSVERMRMLFGLESFGAATITHRRQQITPDIKFTCDGVITKWIIGADWSQESDDTLYPELQVWRKTGYHTYRKMSGTLITIETERDDNVYEYDNFLPIPFQAGDILGVFIPPPYGRSKLRLRSEVGHGPTNYIMDTGEHDMSPYDNFDLQNTPQISSDVYHPLITVEISHSSIANSPTAVATIESPVIPYTTDTTRMPTQRSGQPYIPVSSPSMTLSQMHSADEAITTVISSSSSIAMSPSTTVRDTEETNVILYVSIGVGCAVIVLVLLVTAVIVIICLRMRLTERKLTSFESEHTYYYVYTTGGNVNIATSPNEAEIPVSSNPAYGVVHH